MSKRKMPVVVKIAMLAFLLYAVVTIVRLQSQIADKRAELDSLSQQVLEYEEANEQLRQEMQNGITEEDIGELARSELSYAEPGERVFVEPFWPVGKGAPLAAGRGPEEESGRKGSNAAAGENPRGSKCSGVFCKRTGPFF